VSEKNEKLVAGAVHSRLKSPTQQAKAWTSMLHKQHTSRPRSSEDIIEFRIAAGEKVTKSGGAQTARHLKIFEKALRAEAFSEGSRVTLDRLYRSCPDEATIMWIGQLIARQVKLSPNGVAVRDRAIANAHEWANKAGLDFAIGVKDIA
jgi:hypothetical protein